MGIIVAFGGLGNLLAFAQTAKHMTISKISSFFNLLVVPAAISFLWRISNDFGWWTVLIFIIVSLFIGFMNANQARNNGISSLYFLQPYLGTVFTLCAILCWFV